MNRIVRNRRKTIKNQIQNAIIGISIISMLILGISVYAITTNKIEKNYKEDFSYNLKTADNIMDIQIDNVVELMRNLLIDSEYMNTLLDASKEDSSYFSSYQTNVFETAVSVITLQAEAVQEVLTVSTDGKLYIHSKRSDVSEYTSFYRNKSIISESWIKKVDEKKGKEVIFGNNVLTGEKNTFSIVKSMINPSSGKMEGYVIVNVSKKIFDKAFDNRGTYKTNCFMLIDSGSENQLIYFGGNEDYKEKAYEEYLEGEDDSSDYIFCERDSYIDNWKMVSCIQRTELNEQKKNVGSLILGMIVLLIAVGVVASYNISKKIYKPLKKLELTIQQVEDGNRNITEKFDKSEVGQLGTKFKEMVNNNLVLREHLLYAKIKQREQELHLLQEQINPHFLYNTLDALYCMAEIHGTEDIAKMVEALSETFKLSLNKGSNMICVEDELDHIRAYMTIQNMRFNNRFQLKIDVAEDIYKVKILKLILEPFIENAIGHGLEPKLGEGIVTLSGEREGDGTILFTITDNGIGVDDMDKLEKGYGILNVKERIQLYYGEAYGVTFESIKEQGTTVYIRISEIGMGLINKDEATGDY